MEIADIKLVTLRKNSMFIEWDKENARERERVRNRGNHKKSPLTHQCHVKSDYCPEQAHQRRVTVHYSEGFLLKVYGELSTIATVLHSEWFGYWSIYSTVLDESNYCVWSDKYKEGDKVSLPNRVSHRGKDDDYSKWTSTVRCVCREGTKGDMCWNGAVDFILKENSKDY